MNKEVIIDIENPKDNDLISRQAFITRYDEWMYSEYGHHASEDAFGLRVVKSLPPVNPQKSVLEDIKSEIKFITDTNGVKHIHRDDVFKIIDRHMKGEQE